MNAIIVDKKNKEMIIGEMEAVLYKPSIYYDKDNVEIYKNQTLLDLNRLVVILECYYEIDQSMIKI
jgi:hypothetical protein